MDRTSAVGEQDPLPNSTDLDIDLHCGLVPDLSYKLDLNFINKEIIEEQFGIYVNREGMSLKKISPKIFVVGFLVLLHFAMQLAHVILARKLLNVGKFIAEDKLYPSKCFMLSRFIFLPEHP